MVRRRRALAAVVLGVTIALYLAHVSLVGDRLQDDAFISFRYARNLAEGEGLVWNPGDRVEGYTNFLWTLLLAVPMLVTREADPVSISRALGVASGAATVVVSALLARRVLGGPSLLALAPALLLAASWPFAINSVTGLETALMALLVTLGTHLAAGELEDGRRRGAALAYALGALTRPEGIGLYLVVLGAEALHRGAVRSAAARRELARGARPFAVIVGAHLAFRVAYYGAVVPHTFVVKFGRPLPAGMPTPARYLLEFFTTGLDPLGVLAGLAAVFVATHLRRAVAAPVIAGLAFGVVNVAAAGADFMIGFRYLVPYLPLVLVAACGGCGELLRRLRGQAHARPRAVLALAFALLVTSVAGRHLRHARDVLAPFEGLRRRVTVDAHRWLGQRLGEALPRGATVLTADIGEIGYLSRLRVLDLTGLTEPEVARAPGDVLDRQIDAGALLARDPEAIVLVSTRPGPTPAARLRAGNPYWPPGSSRRLLEHPRMAERYAFATRVPRYVRLVRLRSGELVPPDDARGRGDETFPVTLFLELYLRRDLPPDPFR